MIVLACESLSLLAPNFIINIYSKIPLYYAVLYIWVMCLQKHKGQVQHSANEKKNLSTKNKK